MIHYIGFSSTPHFVSRGFKFHYILWLGFFEGSEVEVIMTSASLEFLISLEHPVQFLLGYYTIRMEIEF